ncbi:MAG: Holliday junction branch migration protein RuvA [Firmicutes bacterium]|nr:Holliday junction branch migration protein RuvA [Bacillota bacterium]
MIDYIKGTLVSALPGKAVLDVGGVGLALEMPSAADHLSNRIGEEVMFYTRLLVKEDEMIIYGFRAAEERKLFNLVLSVSGFGPRLALSLLSILTVSQLYIAVLEENVAQLCRAPGVGKKAAQRLILELKEKLPKVISAEELAGGRLVSSGSSMIDDITEALCALGYSLGEATVAVSRVAEENKDASREELLKLALKNMVRE